MAVSTVHKVDYLISGIINIWLMYVKKEFSSYAINIAVLLYTFRIIIYSISKANTSLKKSKSLRGNKTLNMQQSVIQFIQKLSKIGMDIKKTTKFSKLALLSKTSEMLLHYYFAMHIAGKPVNLPSPNQEIPLINLP